MTTEAVSCPPATLLGQLILVRLLGAGKKPPASMRLRDDVAKFFRHAPDPEEWQTQIDELVCGGLLTNKPMGLTDAGRAEALAFLGLKSLPPRANWRSIQAKYLLAKALGLPTESRQRIKDAKKLAAEVLKRHYGLPARVQSLTQALDALASKLIYEQLGLDGDWNLKAVQAAVLGQLFEPPVRLDLRKLADQLPKHIVGARSGGMKGLREAILLRWVESSIRGAGAPVEFDLSAFARTVQAVARHSPTGWFGDNKVFISHVWRQLQKEPGFPRLALADFKHRLGEANNAGLLRLSRADLVQAMNPDDVRESETPYLNAVFHFILIEREQP